MAEFNKYSLLVLFVCIIVGQCTPSSYEDLQYSPPIYYPPPTYGSNHIDSSKSYKSDYDRCSVSYDDPDGDCITGSGGLDYPVHFKIPVTGFSCRDYPTPGYYADLSTGCQVFHICLASGRRHSTLCPNGTIFNQQVLVCDWWYNVDCPSSPYFYQVNDQVLRASKDATRNYANRNYGNNYPTNNVDNYAHRAPQDYGPSRIPDFGDQNYKTNYGPTGNLDYDHRNQGNQYSETPSSYGHSGNLDYNNRDNYGGTQQRAPEYNTQNYGTPLPVIAKYEIQNYETPLPVQPTYENHNQGPPIDLPVVAKYSIQNLGNAPDQGYNDQYYESPESLQYYDSVGYATTVRPTYVKKTTRNVQKGVTKVPKLNRKVTKGTGSSNKAKNTGRTSKGSSTVSKTKGTGSKAKH